MTKVTEDVLEKREKLTDRFQSMISKFVDFQLQTLSFESELKELTHGDVRVMDLFRKYKEDMQETVTRMKEAIDIATQGIEDGQSPFGAVIASTNGQIIARAHNRVRADTDATAHAEILAIRAAGDMLKTHNLAGHIIATTCEPCPMCAAAIHWARLEQVIYGASIEDAAKAGFNELNIPCDTLYRTAGTGIRLTRGVLGDECRNLFKTWLHGKNPHPY